MKLTPEEELICEKYRKRDENNKVHCFECPLAISNVLCLCKKNMTKKEWEHATNARTDI